MIRAFKYRLYPTRAQEKKLLETFDLCRHLYNGALEERISSYKKFDKSPSLYDQQRSLIEVKELIPKYRDVYAQVLQSTLGRLDKAYKSFFRRVKKSKEKVGFPRYKGRDRFRSICYPQNGFKIEKKEKWSSRLNLSKIGFVPIVLSRPIEGRIKQCRIVRSNIGKWFACFVCTDVPERPLPSTGREIGIDLGISSFFTLSDGQTVENPRHLKRSHMRLSRAQRKLSRAPKGSEKRRKTKSHLARIHEKIVNQREYHAHVVSRSLIERYDTICVEDLDIARMMSSNSRSLNREIGSVGWGHFIEMLVHKAGSAGRRVVRVDPRNTSQMCSGCGGIVRKGLEVRTHECLKCGLVLDRDHNAAINILKRGIECLSASVLRPSIGCGSQSPKGIELDPLAPVEVCQEAHT